MTFPKLQPITVRYAPLHASLLQWQFAMATVCLPIRVVGWKTYSVLGRNCCWAHALVWSYYQHELESKFVIIIIIIITIIMLLILLLILILILLLLLLFLLYYYHYFYHYDHDYVITRVKVGIGLQGDGNWPQALLSLDRLEWVRAQVSESMLTDCWVRKRSRAHLSDR